MPKPLSSRLAALALALAAASAVGASGCQGAAPLAVAQADGALAPPPAGQGVQLTVGPFAVPAGSEVQKNFYMKLPVSQDVMVNRIQIAYGPGSHHFNMFKSDAQDVEDHVEDTFDAIAYENYDMFAAAQIGGFDWRTPAGVGIKLKARQQLLLQTHWVNATTQKTPGGQGVVKVNLWFAEPGTVTTTMGMLFAINKNLDIKPHTTSEASKVIDLKALGWDHDVKVIAMTGHFHSRGKAFEIDRYDGAKGERLYRSDNWDEPSFQRYEPPIELKAGQKLLYTSTFVNDSDQTITFGPHVENQEHSNLFMYFYPGPDSGKAVYDVNGAP